MNESNYIYVYFLNTNAYPLDRIYSVFHKLNPSDRQRSVSFLKEKDRLLFLSGRYLLHKYLFEFCTSETLHQIQYDAFKRPVLKKTSFSISHSENWVVLAAGNNDIEIGIDLEVCIPRYIPDFLEPFCEEEKNYILENNTLSRFYHAWTKKESALKAMGTGFLHNAVEINTKWEEFIYENKKYTWTQLKIATDVLSHICHDHDDIILKLKMISD